MKATRKAPKSGRPKLVALLGGGIDSTVMLSLYRRKDVRVVGVHYDYGQAPVNAERRAVRKVAVRYSTQVYWRKLGMPVKSRGDEYLARNALFVLAAAAEFGPGPLRIGLGAHARSAYYDCSRHFLESMQTMLDGYFDGTVVLEAPLIDSTKAEIVAYARRHRIPLKATFSCTRGVSKPCGRCPSCLDRAVLGV